MFAQALKELLPFTQPVIISKRLHAGQVQCGCATFIIVNDEGWVLTAAHVLNDQLIVEKHSKEVAEYEKKRTDIQSDPRLNPREKLRRTAQLPHNREWITNLSFWWGTDGLRIERFALDRLADLALGKLEPFDASAVTKYPIFKNPEEEMAHGTSLCRLGFPFHTISASFETDTGNFRLADNVLPLPRFPLEGMYTRGVILNDETSGRQTELIETSSPGLGGQSGGPIFDIYGHIWGLQSHTAHLDLGFDATYQRGNQQVVERQFLNVGRGPHVREIIRLLREHNVSYQLSDGARAQKAHP